MNANVLMKKAEQGRFFRSAGRWDTRVALVLFSFAVLGVGAATAPAAPASGPAGIIFDQLQLHLGQHRHNAQGDGLPPYRPCGLSDERKQIGEYQVSGGNRAFMVCGNQQYGFEHIKAGHFEDWSNKAMITGDKWMDLMDYSIEAALKHPEATSQRDGKTCYARQIWMYDKRNGKETGKYFWTNVIVKNSNGDIITAYPTSNAHRCG